MKTGLQSDILSRINDKKGAFDMNITGETGTPARVIFGIVGSGWRSEFFLRIAKALPERFAVCGLVTRSAENGAEIERIWGVKTYRTVDELLKASVPGFMVVSVRGSVTADVIIDLAGKGIPVLTETPPAYDLDKLIQLNRLAKGAKVEAAEQYHLHPMHSARIGIARSGLLGEVSEAQVSFSHGYHAVSLMRRLLGIGFENATINAFQYDSAVIAGPDRKGPPEQERTVNPKHEFALLDFGGKLGVHDFIRDQHRSWIRSQRIIVRGEKGEIFNSAIKYLKDFRTPVEFDLIRKNAGEEGNMEGYCLKGIIAGEEWIYVNQFSPAGLSDDEIAVATCLVKMDEYVRGGQSFYSLAEASQDAYLALMMEKAMSSGEKVVTETQPWATI
jgi:predicted dehydrogenase